MISACMQISLFVILSEIWIFPLFLVTGLRRHLDDIKNCVPEFVPDFVPEFIPEFVPEFDMITDFYSGTNSGMNCGTNFFMSSKLCLSFILSE